MPSPSAFALRATGPTPPRPGAAGPGDDDAAREYRRLFQADPTPLLVIEQDTLHIAAANAAATRSLGHSEPELLASGLADYLGPKDANALTATADRMPVPGALEARSSWKVLRRDGSWARFEVAGGSPVRFHGRLCALLFQPPDAEPTAQDLHMQDAELTQFAFSALHDLKEPLHLVKGYLSLLQQAHPQLDAAAQDYLDNAMVGTQRMQALVLALLEYFRADAKGISTEPVDLGELVDDAAVGLRLQVEEAKATVTRDALPQVLADRMQLGRVLQNLLSNAIKFRSANPPHVHVSCKHEGSSWHVVVADDGIGIPAKDLERVLKPFQRTHSSDQFPGTGLGLSISKKIVELHGGRLWLASAPGQGTQVHFTLPAHEATAAAPTEALLEVA